VAPSEAIPTTLLTPVRTAPGWFGSEDAKASASLSLILALGVVCMFDQQIIGALLTPIKTSLNLSDEQFARIAAVFTVAGMAGAPVFGWLANRFGRKRVLFAGIVIWSLASIGSGLADGIAVLLLWRALTGFGEASYQSLAPSWLADLYRPKWRNLVFSAYMLRNKVGAALAFGIGGWLAANYGWHTAFIVSGFPGLVLAVLVLLVKEPRAGESDGAVQLADPVGFKQGLTVFRRPGFVLHCIALSLFFTGMATQMWVPAFLTRSFQVPNAAAAGFLSAAVLYTLPSGLIGGYLSSLLLRKVPGGFAAFLSVTSLVTAAVFLVAYTSVDLHTAKTFIVVAIAVFGFSAGALTTLIVETVPPHLRASAASFGALVTGGISGIVGPELIGIISDAYGLRTALCLGLTGYAGAGIGWAGLAAFQWRRPAVVT
jgi:MFS family permease